MFHTLAYSASVNSAAFTDTSPVSDQIVAIQNSHFFPSRARRLYYAVHIAASALAFRLVSPRIRQITTSNIVGPSNRNATLLTQQRIPNFLDIPFMVTGNEELEADTLNDAGGAERQNVVLALGDPTLTPAPSGNIYGFLGTSVTAAVASTWTDISVSWNDILPNGRYAIVGLKHSSATGIACRLIVPGQYDRPGCVSSVNRYDDTDPIFRRGNLGSWGEFLNSDMPRLQVLSNSTDNAHTIVMDIVPLSLAS